MNGVRNFISVVIGLLVASATLNICAGFAAWLFCIFVSYDWRK